MVYVVLGIAVDTPKGLVVPVIKHVDQMNIIDIGQEVVRLQVMFTIYDTSSMLL